MKILGEKLALRLVFQDGHTPVVDETEEVVTPTYNPADEFPTIRGTIPTSTEAWYDPLDKLPTTQVATTTPTEEWYDSLDELPSILVAKSTPTSENWIVRTILKPTRDNAISRITGKAFERLVHRVKKEKQAED